MEKLISKKAAIDALDEIQHALWGIDIPSPTVPEYIEHHESVKKVMKVVLEKRKELKNLPSRKKGDWEYVERCEPRWDIHGVKTWGVAYRCSECGFIRMVIEDFGIYKYCPECGADMKGEQDDKS